MIWLFVSMLNFERSVDLWLRRVRLCVMSSVRLLLSVMLSVVLS